MIPMFGDTFFNETQFSTSFCQKQEDLYSPWCQDRQNYSRMRIEGGLNRKKTAVKRRYASEMEGYANFVVSTPLKKMHNSNQPQKEVIKTSITISYEDPKHSSNKYSSPSPYSIKLPVLTPKKHKEDGAEEHEKTVKPNDSLLRQNHRSSLKKYVNNRSRSPEPDFQIFKRQLISTRKYILMEPADKVVGSHF